ncbi:hypothetical protein [Streptomyces sp. NPDC026673]
MKFLAITLIAHAPDPSEVAPVLRRGIPDPPFPWGPVPPVTEPAHH